MTRGYQIALVGSLVLAGLFDLVTSYEGLPIATFAVTALAVVALVRPGERWFALTAVASLLFTLGSLVVDVATFGLAEAGTLVLLVIAAVRRADRRSRWSVTVLLALAVPVLPLRIGLTSEVPVLVAGLAVVVAVAVAFGSALRGSDQARRAAEVAVRRAEREEVARELHDVVAHHVTGMVVATQAARVVSAQTGSGAAPGLDPTLASVEAAGAEALAAMRRLVDVLRNGPGAGPGDPEGPAGAAGRERRTPVPQAGELGDLVRRSGVATGARSVELRGAPGELADLPGEVQTALYRVTQEALTNTARHSPGADRVVVEVARGGGEVSVRITDSGAPGVHPPRVAGPAGGGFGLVGMRERVDALGGSLTVGPHERGWLVHATFPDPAPVAGPVTVSGPQDRWAPRGRGPA